MAAILSRPQCVNASIDDKAAIMKIILLQCLKQNDNSIYIIYQWVNTMRVRQNGCYLTNNIFKWIFFNENVCILIKISLKFVPRGPINNIPSLVQIMAWHRPGDKPLSEPMMVC